MFGDSFFTARFLKGCTLNSPSFRPHVWGFFFHILFSNDVFKFVPNVFVPMFGDSFFTTVLLLILIRFLGNCFRPHVWGFFFHNIVKFDGIPPFIVFVPMFGDSFFTGICPFIYQGRGAVFVPMFGDSFFTLTVSPRSFTGGVAFSSPCLGILFSLSVSPHKDRGQKVFVPMFGDSFFTTPMVRV